MIKYILAIAIFFCNCEKSTGAEATPNSNENNKTVQQDSVSDEVDQADNEEVIEEIDSTLNPIQDYYLYIGTYTDAGSKGIYLSKYEAETGILSQPELVANVNNASFQAISKDQTKLFSVSEAGGGSGQVIAFDINTENGTLKQTSTNSTERTGPCYFSYHDNSESILAANYRSGNVTRITTTETYAHQHEGKGPNASRQERPHAHCFKIDLNNEFAYSCDLGTDKIYAYNLNDKGLV